MSSLVARLHNAAVTPEAWPDALTALTDAAGVAGAALIIFNKNSGKVDEAHFCGLSAGFKSDYVRQMTPRRMPLLLPSNSRKTAAGTDLPFSLRTTADTR